MSAAISKISSTVTQKVLEESQKLNKPLDQEKSFQEVLDETDIGLDFAEDLGISNEDKAPSDSVNSLDAGEVNFESKDLAHNSSGDSSRQVVAMLSDVNNGQMQMDKLVNHVLYSGKKFSNQELLVIQAHIHQFAQMTEMTVKVAEQSVGSVKTVLNTQVQ